ncbi:hypothetical protein RIF29_41592 [Crotalaria pallida]|uniref:Uncharacterized protein n=1 Tax=Crotalaria pallida TaxID=3830 RepID=A0AAN9HSU7_CROPI
MICGMEVVIEILGLDMDPGRIPPTHPYCCRASHRHRRRPAIVAPYVATIAIHSVVVSLSLRSWGRKLWSNSETPESENCFPTVEGRKTSVQ